MESGRVFFDGSVSHVNMLSLGNLDLILQGTRSAMNMEELSSRRHFLNTPKDFSNEEYYHDDHLPEKKCRLTLEQVHLLEKSFEEENKLEPQRKNQLAKKLGLRPRKVAVWFQNQRARCKTKQLQTDYDLLKSSYDGLLSKHELILKENQMLKSEVGSLTGKLQADHGIMELTSNQNPNVFPGKITNAYDVQFNLKPKDHLSYANSVLEEDYFQEVFVRAHEQEQEHQQDETLRWWVWS